MNEIKLITDQLKQTFDGKAWHGPSLMQTLKNVDWTQIKVRPIGSRHTIWEIVNHCSYWMEAVVQTLKGEKIQDLETIKDWPPMGESKEQWDNTLTKLQRSFKSLIVLVQNSSENSLSDKKSFSYQGKEFTFTHRKMLHGISDHNIYHAGQIAILRSKETE